MFNPMGKQSESVASTTPISLEAFKMALPVLCHSGCDRIPLSVRDIVQPLYLSGFNKSHIFLTHGDTCMVSQFSFDNLVLPTQTGLDEIHELVFAWRDSAMGIASSELRSHAQLAEKSGVSIALTLRWPEGGHTRKGTLTEGSKMQVASDTQWVPAVEVIESKSVTFRYGFSRIGTAMHDGKLLTLRLKPGTAF